MKTLTVSLLFSIIMMSALTSAAFADDLVIIDPIGRVITPPPPPPPPLNQPDYVRVRSMSYAGTGCPAGSVSSNVSPDLHAFTLYVDSFTAEVGPGIPFSNKRKHCAINVDLDVPHGWSYTVVSSDFRGYAALESQVRATIQTRYYFQGSAQTTTFQTFIVGPLDRFVQFRDNLSISEMLWSPCGSSRALNLSFEARLDNSTNSNRQGFVSIDTIDGYVRLAYALKWRRC